MNKRICKLCGEEFMPKSSRQSYCKKEILKKCPVCGDEFVTYCHPDSPITCSKPECKKKAGYIGSIGNTRKCKICGEEFKPTSTTQLYCNKPVKRVCKVCGKEFTIKCCAEEYKKQTCSEECMNKLGSQHRQESHMKKTRICELCGKEFHPRSNTQKVCDNEHFRKCIVCGKEFKLNYKAGMNLNDLRTTCSDECYRSKLSLNNPFSNPEIQQKMRNTMLTKYGVEFAAQNSELLKKQKATTFERYGVEFMMQSEEGKNRIKETNRRRYGVDWALQNESVREKQIETNRQRYGVDNPMQNTDIAKRMFDAYKQKTGYSGPGANPEVQHKKEQTNLHKYGVKQIFSSKEIRSRIKQTMQERYGVDNPMKCPKIMQKAIETNNQRYGADWYLASDEGKKKSIERMNELYGKVRFSQLAEWKEQVMKECTNIEEWMKFTDHPAQYIISNYSERPTYRRLGIDLGVMPSTVCDVICRKGLTGLIKYSLSYMEEEFKDFLDSLDVEYKFHERKLISPYEIDIIIPEYKLGIECNPTSTHNSSIPYMDNDMPTHPNYHKMKTDMCEEQGISLLHVFGYDWTHKKDIILSMIRNRLGKSDKSIYARKCEVVEVSGATAIQFLNMNHRQGAANSPVRLGLEYNGELVSLMTFGSMRRTIGTGNDNLENCWELVRFCSLLNTSVVGGASKLLKYFIANYNPERIRSFSDRAHTSGKLYSVLGFKEIRRSDPGYVWVNVVDDRAYHRTNAQKQHIKKFLKDDSIDLSKTEREIMIEHGFVQVYDSGTVTWELVV